MAYAGKSGEAERLRPALNSMSRNESRPVTATTVGIAVGLLVGAGIALLFAPHEGWESRRRLRSHLRRVHHRGLDAWDELSHELHTARRKLRRARRRLATTADAAGDPLD